MVTESLKNDFWNFLAIILRQKLPAFGTERPGTNIIHIGPKYLLALNRYLSEPMIRAR